MADPIVRTSSGRPASAREWRPTWSLRRVIIVVLFAVSLALIVGRPNMALLVLPLSVAAASAWASRDRELDVTLAADMLPMADQGGRADVAFRVTGLDRVEMAALWLPRGLGPNTPPTLVIAPDPPNLRLSVPADTTEWGVHSFGPAALRVAGPDGLFTSDVVTTYVPPIRVLPRIRAVPVPELPARTAGQVGAHRTRRPGDGSELLDVREFRPGDRIRRIDWRVSARREKLHVRHTAIDADADLVICLDVRYDLSDAVEDWAFGPARQGTGSLDTTVEACTALAAAYLRQGDRVGLIDLTLPHRGLPPGTGRRQLIKIRWLLAGIVPDAHLHLRRFDEGALPAGAVAIVLSPYLDAQIETVVMQLARARRDVVLIDVLPVGLRLPRTRSERVAARLVLAEREERIATARQRGVLVVPWDPALLGLWMRRRQRMRRPA